MHLEPRRIIIHIKQLDSSLTQSKILLINILIPLTFNPNLIKPQKILKNIRS